MEKIFFRILWIIKTAKPHNTKGRIDIMKKRILVAILALALLLSMVACGTGNSAGTENGAGTETAAPAVEQPAADEPVVQLELYALSFDTAHMTNLESVNEAVNEYIRPLINAEVKLNVISIGSYSQQVNLMMSGSEQVDLLLTTGSLTTSLASMGGLLPLDSYLESHGQGIIDTMGEDVLAACRCSGEIYGVPTNRDLARSVCYFYREDLNESMNLGLENAKTLEDLEACFDKMLAQDPEMVAYAGSNASATSNQYNWEQLCSNFGVLLNNGEDLTVYNLYETEEYREFIETMYHWNQKGYFYKEIDTSTASVADLFATGKMLGFIANGNPAQDNAQSQVMGYTIKHVELVPAVMTSATVQTASWAIPHNCANPEKAMELLNLMYTDATLVNLLTYGIEGENYVVVDEENGIIDYPEGMTVETKTYDNTIGWEWGNMLIGYTWQGDEATLHEDMVAFNESALRSKALGFTFDSSNVQNELTACRNVAAKYAIGLEFGKLDPETTLPLFIQELKDAGIDTIIAAEQEQLDAWAAANGVK